MMNNYEKIRLINEIVQPNYTFDIESMNGDRGSSVYPNIEDLNYLFFKKKKIISMMDEVEIIEKIKGLNIGFVEKAKIQAIGHFIVIEVKENKTKEKLNYLVEVAKRHHTENLEIFAKQENMVLQIAKENTDISPADKKSLDFVVGELLKGTQNLHECSLKNRNSLLAIAQKYGCETDDH
jgi:hypothetical protein